MKKVNAVKAVLISTGCLLTVVLGYCAWAIYKFKNIKDYFYIDE